jgi:phosphoribosylformylglycinamidine synthase
VDIGDGFCAVFKMESHNHPSYIEPYQGAATGVGGILRDVFTMGARPVASLNSLRFGRADHPKTPHLLKGVVAGIGGYGNCIGVPTVGGEVQFDASYDGNILVNAFTVGIAKTDDLFFGVAEGVGNPIIYVGAKTGRDGIHGATMASAEFGEETDSKLPTVQVGDPFMEKLLLEACLEIFATDCLSGVQDMGAAGLTSSSVEMADRAGNGIELDLDAIPRRTKALSPYEMLLSESQERMLMVAKEGREQEVFELCAKWDLDASIVGRVTDTGRFVCKATPGYDPFDATGKPDPVVVVDLPVDLLTNAAPKYDRPQQERVETASLVNMSGDAPDDLGDELVRLIGSPNIGSRSWIWRQYDHIVRDGTVIRPGEGDAAVIRVFCDDADGRREKYLAISADCNGRHVELDPFAGAAMAVAECTRNVVCVGAKPLGLTDCLNFGNPEVPEQMWRFARAIDGLAAACTALDAPVVSGNVSLYNETDGKAILPTPTVAVVGQLENPEHRLGLGFSNAGDVIAHLGRPSRGVLGGSEWLVQRTGSVTGSPVGIDLDAEAALQRAVLALARAKLLTSAHDISDGGFAVCLAEACIARGHGAKVSLPANEDAPAHALMFSEEPSRIIVSLNPNHLGEVLEVCERHGVPFEKLGIVTGQRLVIEGVCDVSIEALEKSHASALNAVVG